LTAKIIPFPKKPEPKLTEIENLIRRWLAAMSANHELMEYVVNRMLYFIEKYASKSFEPIFNLPVPPNFSKAEADALLLSIEKGVDNTANQVHEMINNIIIERFFLEIEIYETQKKGQNCPK
jgi:lantibiotic modifying enzyme